MRALTASNLQSSSYSSERVSNLICFCYDLMCYCFFCSVFLSYFVCVWEQHMLGLNRLRLALPFCQSFGTLIISLSYKPTICKVILSLNGATADFYPYYLFLWFKVSNMGLCIVWVEKKVVGWNSAVRPTNSYSKQLNFDNVLSLSVAQNSYLSIRLFSICLINIVVCQW